MGKASSSVYNINYHVVWCPKYRKPVLTGKIKEFLEEQIETIAETKGYKILEKKVMPDHVHLFLEANPFDSPINIVKVFKGVSSLRISKRFPELREQMWRGVLWSPSYYVGTAGHVSAELIERYIKEQERYSSTG